MAHLVVADLFDPLSATAHDLKQLFDCGKASTRLNDTSARSKLTITMA
jgi:hypothetical protein